ncbi:MAG: hypothetical protein HPZ79_00870 [Oscillospiraceae bacterium]|nr:hypothetical protein [Oscillospiraceae bacterium]
MPDYKQMYRALFRATTEAIELLQRAQIQAEEIYLPSEAQVIPLIQPGRDEREE